MTKKYKNLSGNSGLKTYTIGSDFIEVCFKNGLLYRYSYATTGKELVDQMKTLAAKGIGFCRFINKHVRRKVNASGITISSL